MHEAGVGRHRHDQALAVLPGQSLGLGTETGHVQRDGLLDIDELVVLHQKLDRMGLTLPGEVNLLAAQQAAQHPQIVGELLEFHRLVAHQPGGRVAGADAQEGPARSQLVDGGDAVGRDRRQAGAGNRHPGSDLHATGLLGGQGQNRITVRPDHLTVGYPGVRVAQVLGVGDIADLVDLRGSTNPKIHPAAPQSHRASLTSSVSRYSVRE